MEVSCDLLPAQIIRMMLEDGVWVPWPELVDPVITPGLVVLDALPDGSVAVVTDGETGEVLATVTEVDNLIRIELPEPGPYQVEVTPPLPWLPISFGVVVHGFCAVERI